MKMILNSVLLAALLCSFAGFVKAQDTRSQVTEEFMDAVDNSDFNLADEKLAHGADINGADKDGWAALHFRALSGDLRGVWYLFACHANINQKNVEGKTPLHLAAAYGHLGVVKYLVEQGADIFSKDNDGKTARDLAADGKHQLVVSYLTSAVIWQARLDRSRSFDKSRGFLESRKDLMVCFSAAAVLVVGLRWWYARRHGLSFIPKINWFGRQRISAMPKVMGPVIASMAV